LKNTSLFFFENFQCRNLCYFVFVFVSSSFFFVHRILIPPQTYNDSPPQIFFLHFRTCNLSFFSHLGAVTHTRKDDPLTLTTHSLILLVYSLLPYGEFIIFDICFFLVFSFLAVSERYYIIYINNEALFLVCSYKPAYTSSKCLFGMCGNNICPG